VQYTRRDESKLLLSVTGAAAEAYRDETSKRPRAAGLLRLADVLVERGSDVLANRVRGAASRRAG